MFLLKNLDWNVQYEADIYIMQSKLKETDVSRRPKKTSRVAETDDTIRMLSGMSRRP